MPELKVLVIDDEKALLDVLRKALALMSCQMVGAATLRDGLKAAQAEDFDLILLDNHFPEGHGDAIVAPLMSANPNAPIVIITGNASDAHVDSALKLGAREVLEKPFGLSALASAIERHSRRLPARVAALVA